MIQAISVSLEDQTDSLTSFLCRRRRRIYNQWHPETMGREFGMLFKKFIEASESFHSDSYIKHDTQVHPKVLANK
jgi:hypothetical protein